jgi:hypothetical protein
MERTAHRQSRDSDVFVRLDETLTRMQRGRQAVADGAMRAGDNYRASNSMPRYLSDPDGEPDPMEFAVERPRRSAATWLIMAAGVALASLAAFTAAYYWQISRVPADHAKIALEVAADVAMTALKPQDLQAAPVAQPPSEEQAQPSRIASADPAVAPASREATASAYQSALQSQAPMVPPATVEVPAVQSPAAAQTPPLSAPPQIMAMKDAIHRLAPDEMAALLKRADILIASGDVAAARLVLRRPAEAGNAYAAATLAKTYDAAVLAKLGVRGVVPDMEMARAWYEKAKQFGSAEASRRLETLASKRQ